MNRTDAVRRAAVGRRWMAGLAMSAAGLALVGCAGNKDYNAAVAENAELRNQIATLQHSLDDCEGRYAAAEGQNRQLAEQMAMRGPGDTGFEGISGAGVRRGSGGDVIVDVAGDVLFDSGSAVLKPSAKKTLDSIAQVVRTRYNGNTIRVEGYTDTDPIRKSKWKSNERLSGERAMAVEEYMVSKGIGADRIYFAGFGPAKPRGSKAQSRRVEIVILGG